MVTVFCFDTALLEDRETYLSAYASMPEERRRRADNFLQAEDRRRCVGAYLALQAGLEALGAASNTVSLERATGGAPLLSGAEGLFISLAHSGDLALCAFADSPVGVDVEKLRLEDCSFLRSVLSERETLYLDSLGGGPLRCLSLWTLKESFLKATWLGMSLDPKAFSAAPLAGIIPPICFAGREYRLSELSLGDEYVGAVCLETSGTFDVEIRTIH